MFKDLKIGSRLGIGFSLIILIFILLSLIIINRLDQLTHLTTRMYMHPFTVSNAVLRLDADIVRIHRSMKDVALAKTFDEITEVIPGSPGASLRIT